MNYKIKYRFDFDTEKEMNEFLEQNGYIIDYINSQINIKHVYNKLSKDYEGTIKIIRNDENDEAEYQWWEPIPDQYIKIKEASVITGLSPNTIRNLVCKGDLKAYKQGKFLVFNSEDLKEWVNKRTIEKVKPE